MVRYFDQLGVHNQYYVPQVGIATGLSYQGFFCEASGKLGLGMLQASAKLDGGTTQQLAGVSTQSSGGVLAPPGGRAARENGFAVIPEFSLKGGYQIASWCRVIVGYNFLYASQIVRASSLVGAVDVRQVPQLPSYDPTAPATGLAPLHYSSFVVQGLTAGLEFRY